MVSCVLTWPLQQDRIAFDEVREAMRAFALAGGEVTFAMSWEESVHPPLVPALTALFLQFVPEPVALRLPELIAGFGGVALAIGIGRRLGRPEAGAMAGLMLAASPIWWAYACAVSLDLPLAALTALAAYAVIGDLRRWWLVIVAIALAALTKRQGLTLVTGASLLALLTRLRGFRMAGAWRVVVILALVTVFGLGAWKYRLGGLEMFGVTRRLDELLTTAPTVIGLAAVAVVGFAVLLWRATPVARRLLWALALFTTPLALAPLTSSHPAPRYFLPALPTACVALAVGIWGWGGTVRPARRWALCAIILAGWFGVQEFDLQRTYWPKQRGHRAAARWIAANVPDDAVVFSPCGMFVGLAAAQEGVTTAELVDVDRNTCGRLEVALQRETREAWVVLPLYRELGWPPGMAVHAKAMGLELRALVRRAEPAVRDEVPWRDERSVVTLGPVDGTPVLAILKSVRRPKWRALVDHIEPVVLLDAADPGAFGRWELRGVEPSPGEHGGARLLFGGSDLGLDVPETAARIAQFRGREASAWMELGGVGAPDLAYLMAEDIRVGRALATDDWHHHTWLEIEVRATPEALRTTRLGVGYRSWTKLVRLSEVVRGATEDGWQRCVLSMIGVPVEQRSEIQWLALSAWFGPGDGRRPEVELRRIRLLRDP